ETPRYLFRVFSPYSQGATDTKWVKSRAASRGLACSSEDIFSIENKQRAADMLSRHLQWWKNPHDNLVSWTSSLLSALVYIFHLRAIHSEATLDEIQLLVVDTAIFPKGAFMRDLDLVRAFRSVDQHLRNKKSKWSSGYYYFGEYLSQGALKVEGRCQVASAQNIVNDGLYTIRKEFRGFADWKPGSARWADVVIEMRKVFHYDISTRREMSKRAMSAVLRISRQFGPDFQTPIAANLVAIAAPRYRHVPTQFIYPELPLLTGSCICYWI
ncbi:hypothetical protein CI102_2649, partial [Trichoderma harzianum]